MSYCPPPAQGGGPYGGRAAPSQYPGNPNHYPYGTLPPQAHAPQPGPYAGHPYPQQAPAAGRQGHYGAYDAAPTVSGGARALSVLALLLGLGSLVCAGVQAWLSSYFLDIIQGNYYSLGLAYMRGEDPLTGRYFPIVTLCVAVVALFFSVAARKRLPRGRRGVGTAALTFSIIGLVVGAAQLAVCTVLVGVLEERILSEYDLGAMTDWVNRLM